MRGRPLMPPTVCNSKHARGGKERRLAGERKGGEAVLGRGSEAGGKGRAAAAAGGEQDKGAELVRSGGCSVVRLLRRLGRLALQARGRGGGWAGRRSRFRRGNLHAFRSGRRPRRAASCRAAMSARLSARAFPPLSCPLPSSHLVPAHLDRAIREAHAHRREAQHLRRGGRKEGALEVQAA